MIWEALDSSLIVTGLEADDYKDVMKNLGSILIKEGYAKESYIDALITREDEFSTGLDVDGIGVAIPHTSVEHVNKVGIAIATLDKPVSFVQMGTDDETTDVRLIFMLAVVNPDAHIGQLQRIIKIILKICKKEPDKFFGSMSSIVPVRQHTLKQLNDKQLLIGQASTMMSESIEWIGAEHVLANRAADKEVHNQIIKICEDYEEHLKAQGQDCRAGQPTPGNKAGGLSTLDEKSLGCIRKGGTCPIVEVLQQAERPTKKGAIVMDTAGYDISSVTSMVAGGCNAVIFTTGRGTCTGNAIVPVLKVTANKHTYQWMEDNMDIDLSAAIDGTKTFKEWGKEMLKDIEDICNGKLTKAEACGFSDIAVDHVCRFV